MCVYEKYTLQYLAHLKNRCGAFAWDEFVCSFHISTTQRNSIAKYLAPNVAHDYNDCLTLIQAARCCCFHFSLALERSLKLLQLNLSKCLTSAEVSCESPASQQMCRRPVTKVAQTNALKATHPNWRAPAGRTSTTSTSALTRLAPLRLLALL